MFATDILLTLMIRHRLISLNLTIHHVLDIITSLGVCFQGLLVEIDRARTNVFFIFDMVYAEGKVEAK